MVEFYNMPPFQFSNHVETASVDLLRVLCSDCEDPLCLRAQLCHKPDLLVRTCPLWRQKGCGDSGLAMGRERSPPCPRGSGCRGQAVGALAAPSPSWIYCWFSVEGVREPAKGVEVKDLGFPISALPAGMNQSGALVSTVKTANAQAAFQCKGQEKSKQVHIGVSRQEPWKMKGKPQARLGKQEEPRKDAACESGGGFTRRREPLCPLTAQPCPAASRGSAKGIAMAVTSGFSLRSPARETVMI